MASIVITEAEILSALAEAAPGAGPDEARTIAELSGDTGVSESNIRSALRRLQAEGRLGVHRVRRPALDGRLASVPGYTILPKVTPKRKR